MKKIVISNFKAPEKLADYPIGPNVESGYLTEGNAGMRTFRPVIDHAKCVKCLRCYVLCPDAAIAKSGEKIEIDLTFCKGCGVCAYECKPKAITMAKEESQ
jgi:pyruvate ferredoxin oxidoreductase delta subunit